MLQTRRLRNVCMWGVCLFCGSIVGALMLPIELLVEFVAWVFGAKDASFRTVGFVFRQFTDTRALRDMYPISDGDE